LKYRHAQQWKKSELSRILKAAGQLKGVYCVDRDKALGTVPRAVWWRAFILASRDSGLPRKVLYRLTRNMIAADGSFVVRIEGQPDVPMRFSRATLEALEKLPLTGRLFGFRGRPCATTFQRLWRRILTIAKLFDREDRLTCTPHGVQAIDFHCDPAAASTSLADFFHTVYQPMRLGGRSERTIALYLTTLRAFGRFLGRQPLLSDLNDLAVAQYLASGRKRKLSPHTVDKERDQLCALWRFACDRNMVKDRPNVQKEIVPKRLPQAWLDHELRALFKAIDELPGWLEGVRACHWWRALHLVIWDSGERISAVMDLRWEHVDLKGGWLRVPAELRKGKGADKVFKLHEETVKALRTIQSPEREALFPWPFGRTYLWQKYEPILKAAGLPTSGQFKFHRLRRSVASFFEAAGGDATELLGHSARSVTRKHYLDERIVKPKQASDLLFRPGSKAASGDAAAT
jgi:integrase